MAAFLGLMNFASSAEQERRKAEAEGSKGADIFGRIADPTGFVSNKTAWGKKGFLGTGWQPFKDKYADDMDPARWQDRIDPALMKQLMAQASGTADSAAETLGKEMVERNQRGMLGAAISGESAGGGTAVRQGMQAGERHALDMGPQIMAMRQQEQARAQQMLMQAMMQGSSLDDALAMFRAEMAMRQETQRSQMMAQGLGAGLAAFTSYQQQQGGGGAEATVTPTSTGVGGADTPDGGYAYWGENVV